MDIVLNETVWAESHISSRTIGSDAYSTFRRVARYYMDGGYDRDAVRKKLDAFLLSCNPTASPVRWEPCINNAFKHALRQPAVDVGEIAISKKEMETIRGLDGKQVQRVAFTLLCLAKFWNAYSPKNDSWVRTPDNEIMRLANVKTSVKRQCSMFRDLRDCGMLTFSKRVDNTNVRVNFIADDDADAMIIDDFRNLGYQYLMYLGEPYFKCTRCGIVSRLDNPNKGRKQKYCHECAIKVKAEQDVNAAMKRRTRNDRKNDPAKTT